MYQRRGAVIVMYELGLAHRLQTTTDAQLKTMYSSLAEKKAVLRPLLIQRNLEKGLAVPKVHCTFFRLKLGS
jgi:hypothetical protein